MTSKHGAQWDEYRAGRNVPDPRNLISFPKDGPIYQSTCKAIHERTVADDDDDFMNVPSVHIERFFKYAAVRNPAALNRADDRVLVRCLGIKEYLDDGLDYLLDEGCFEVQDDDGNWVPYVYDSVEDLYEEVDAVVLKSPDCPQLMVDDKSWDWLQDFDVASVLVCRVLACRVLSA